MELLALQSSGCEVKDEIVSGERCEICTKQVSVYKCPSCGCKTCSLACINEHKKLKKCTGRKAPTKMVKKEDFSLEQLNEDYRFLMSAENVLDRAKRTLRHERPNIQRAIQKKRRTGKPKPQQKALPPKGTGPDVPGDGQPVEVPSVEKDGQ